MLIRRTLSEALEIKLIQNFISGSESNATRYALEGCSANLKEYPFVHPFV